MRAHCWDGEGYCIGCGCPRGEGWPLEKQSCPSGGGTEPKPKTRPCPVVEPRRSHVAVNKRRLPKAKTKLTCWQNKMVYRFRAAGWSGEAIALRTGLPLGLVRRSAARFDEKTGKFGNHPQSTARQSEQRNAAQKVA